MTNAWVVENWLIPIYWGFEGYDWAEAEAAATDDDDDDDDDDDNGNDNNDNDNDYGRFASNLFSSCKFFTGKLNTTFSWPIFEPVARTINPVSKNSTLWRGQVLNYC